MRLFLLGDFMSDNGPGNANKQIRDVLAMQYKLVISNRTSKICRVLEIIKGVILCNILIITSKSKVNRFAIKMAKIFRKPIIYVMHGYSSHELKINNPEIEEAVYKNQKEYEAFIFNSVDVVVCVSKLFMKYMKAELPEYASKFSYIYNSIDITKLKKISSQNQSERNEKQILSVGGGMRRKNNKVVSDVVEKMSEKLQYVIVGEELEDGQVIKKNKKVIWKEHMLYSDMCKEMNKSKIYIQNSEFETFGLAVVEALYSGCDLLISKNIGCIDLFKSIQDDDIIYDINDEKEIEGKILGLLRKSNNKRLLEGFAEECVSKEWQIKKWEMIIEGLNKKGCVVCER